MTDLQHPRALLTSCYQARSLRLHLHLQIRAHTKLIELVAEFLIGFLDTGLCIFFWLLRIHVVQRARLYALRRAQEEIEVIDQNLEHL